MNPKSAPHTLRLSEELPLTMDLTPGTLTIISPSGEKKVYRVPEYPLIIPDPKNKWKPCKSIPIGEILDLDQALSVGTITLVYSSGRKEVFRNPWPADPLFSVRPQFEDESLKIVPNPKWRTYCKFSSLEEK